MFNFYYILIIEICWMFIRFVRWKGKEFVICICLFIFFGYGKIKSCLVFGEMNMYILYFFKEVGKFINFFIGFCFGF